MSTAVAQMMSAPPSPPGSNTPWGARYASEIRQVIVRQASRQPRNQQEFLGPSELGTVCDRQVVGKMIAAPVTNHVPDPWPSIVGTAVHAWLADKFARENDLIGMLRWLTETRVAPDPVHPGTADLFDLFEGALVDWKGLDVRTPIATPDGWTAMGQLNPGDTVFGADGRPCQVTRTYPVQQRDCYRITFNDGSHLVTDDIQEIPFTITGRQPKPALLSTAEAAGKIWRSGNWPQRQLRLANGRALELPPHDLLVHPYVLGCWLGDGSVHSGTIGTDNRDAREMFRHIRDCGYKVSPPYGKRKFIRNVYGLSGQLQILKLQWRDPEWPRSHGRLAGVKRIPAEYLRGSFEQRLSLLQGLMDTDGNWNRPRKRAVFSTTDKDLAEATAELVTTLGWKAHIAPHQSTGFGLTVTEYYVEFTPVGFNPFRLSRKAGLVRLEGSRFSGYRIVQSIESIPSVSTRCIDVNSPDHLYLAGEQMIPVHNCLGPTSMDKVKSPSGPSRQYQVQLLLYARGFRNYGAQVNRIALVALPRTAATLDAMFVWEHVVDIARDDALVDEVLRVTAIRRQIAAQILEGRMTLAQVPATPDSGECFYCPLYRPQAAYDGGPGCPGTYLTR